MNYAFSTSGVINDGPDGRWDYHSAPVTLFNETDLNEDRGLGPQAAGYGTSHFCPEVDFFGTPIPNIRLPVNDAAGPIAWNCNGVLHESGYNFDVNNDSPRQPPGTLNLLASHDDWRSLKLVAGAVDALSGPLPELPRVTTGPREFTPKDLAQIIPPDSVPPISKAVAAPPRTRPAGTTPTSR